LKSGCCDYVKKGSVYAYVPAKFDNTSGCEGGGVANQCSDYKYTAKGFYCGTENACKAWAYQGGPALACNDTLKSCCENLSKWNKLSGTYLTTCCNCANFRKNSSAGVSACCGSASTGFKDKCCADASYSFCCDTTKITISCSGSSSSYNSGSTTCTVSGCLAGYMGHIDYVKNGTQGGSNIDHGGSLYLTNNFSGTISYPSVCRSCAIVLSSNTSQTANSDAYQSPCSGGTNTWTGSQWRTSGTQNTNCYVSCTKSGSTLSCTHSNNTTYYKP